MRKKGWRNHCEFAIGPQGMFDTLFAFRRQSIPKPILPDTTTTATATAITNATATTFGTTTETSNAISAAEKENATATVGGGEGRDDDRGSWGNEELLGDQRYRCRCGL
ncbi:hypothetical protein L596_000665 [Steinernema carpocapsae]|uniref:Uncharacterized protein n=1 Tax=Steinernema carpocapsae TaxID=34508 RepID=A0A4U8UIR8_STECR|nr:hypothetical protein L596_000665 [Steinernema carpocapsae]